MVGGLHFSLLSNLSFGCYILVWQNHFNNNFLRSNKTFGSYLVLCMTKPNLPLNIPKIEDRKLQKLDYRLIFIIHLTYHAQMGNTFPYILWLHHFVRIFLHQLLSRLTLARWIFAFVETPSFQVGWSCLCGSFFRCFVCIPKG